MHRLGNATSTKIPFNPFLQEGAFRVGLEGSWLSGSLGFTDLTPWKLLASQQRGALPLQLELSMQLGMPLHPANSSVFRQKASVSQIVPLCSPAFEHVGKCSCFFKGHYSNKVGVLHRSKAEVQQIRSSIEGLPRSLLWVLLGAWAW